MAIGGGWRRFNRVGEERAAAVRRVSDADRNAREACHPRGVKRILKENREIELVFANFARQF